MKIRIGKKWVGEKEPAFIIAEAGVNHNGSLELAKKLIEKAAEAGADAIKFQTYKAEKLVTKTAPRFWNWEGEEKPDGTQFDSYARKEHHLDNELYPELVKTCEKNNIEFLSTPFDEDSADFLEKLGMKAFKIASGDLTNLPLVRHIARKKLPVILSTGAATMEDIKEAVKAIKDEGNNDLVLLHCTLCYPTPPKDANLRLINTLSVEFPSVPIGLSDHTLGTLIPAAAVAIGAKVIEKHYTLNKNLLKNADHWMSVDPQDLKEMVEYIRTVEKALGSDKKEVFNAEESTHKYARRSIVSNCYIPKGTIITEKMLIMKRPGTGIRPNQIKLIVGKSAKKDIPEDTMLKHEDFS